MVVNLGTVRDVGEPLTDSITYFVRVLVLPEPQHGPTCKLKSHRRVSISLSSSGELRRPVGRICLRYSAMRRTCVPEAATQLGTGDTPLSYHQKTMPLDALGLIQAGKQCS
jgi:hypothetical protein